MTAHRLLVEGVSKAFPVYRSEAMRFAHWAGMPVAPERMFWALRDVDFRLAAGESVAVVGGNGAGKSTLLKVVSGTLAPTSGHIAVAGSRAAILELGLDFNADLTGRENVRLYAGLMGLRRDEIDALEPAVRQFAEVGDAYDQPVRTYSTGMQARVAFALATARRTDLLVVDEVLSVGDAHFQAKSFARILDYQASGTSILFVTHGLGDVGRVCRRALWLDHGRVAMDGPTEVVIAASRGAQARAVQLDEQRTGA